MKAILATVRSARSSSIGSRIALARAWTLLFSLKKWGGRRGERKRAAVPKAVITHPSRWPERQLEAGEASRNSERSIAAGHFARAGRLPSNAPGIGIIGWTRRRSPCPVRTSCLIIIPAVIPEGPRILQKPKCDRAQYDPCNQKACTTHHPTPECSRTEHGVNAWREKKLSGNVKKLK